MQINTTTRKEKANKAKNEKWETRENQTWKETNKIHRHFDYTLNWNIEIFQLEFVDVFIIFYKIKSCCSFIYASVDFDSFIQPIFARLRVKFYELMKY